MKYILIVPDGAADYATEMLGKKTPLEVAEKPFMNSLAKEGLLGRVKTIPQGFSPSSDVANLALLGYEPQKYYAGRGPLEAANLGVELGEEDLAFRCNLITEADGKILDYSAGHITDPEAKVLIQYISDNINIENLEFYFGKSYRNLMVYRKGKNYGLEQLKYFAPHDIMGQEIEKHLPSGKNSELITSIIFKSQRLLRDHIVNNVRVDLKENPANMLWLWGVGAKLAIPNFKEKFGLEGAVISAVDLIKGIGRIIGLEVINVEGATAYYDTNYEGKAKAALEALKRVDFVFIHIEATDEAGHNGDLRMKITCTERIDKLIVGTILEKLKGKDFRILIAPDHHTPVVKRTHTDEPVPFLIYGKGINKGAFSNFCEAEAATSELYFDSGLSLLEYFFRQ